MKKKYSFFIFLMMMAGMFTSCNSKIETNTSIAKTETDFQKDTTACDCSEIVSKRSSDGNPVKGEEHIMYKNGIKFTGACIVKQFDDKSNKEYRMYKNGLLDGTYYSWFENGKNRIKIDFVKGLIHGKFEEWNETGKQIADISYKQGKLNGNSYYLIQSSYDKQPRHLIFMSDERVEQPHSQIWKSDFEDNFSTYKKNGNYLVKIERQVTFARGNVLLYKNDKLEIDPDKIKNLQDLDSFLDFAKEVEKKHQVKINITGYHPSSWRYLASNVYGDYYWSSGGNGTPKKQEIDDKIYQKFIDKKIGFDPALMKAFTNGVKEEIPSNSSTAPDIFEDDVSDEEYDYTR